MSFPVSCFLAVSRFRPRVLGLEKRRLETVRNEEKERRNFATAKEKKFPESLIEEQKRERERDNVKVHNVGGEIILTKILHFLWVLIMKGTIFGHKCCISLSFYSLQDHPLEPRSQFL